ncbi:MAG: holo-ACP synthase [Thiotrichales bacterium]|nr:holo-ACP synthase [Thiotrichales bacterium]
MEHSLKRFGNRIAKKILTGREFDGFKQSNRPASFLAKRFAAKEAMAKALGTGFRKSLTLKQIELVHDPSGKPHLECVDHAHELLVDNNIDSMHISISDEQDYAVAMVVLEVSK